MSEVIELKIKRDYLSWKDITGEIDAMKVHDLFICQVGLEEMFRCANNIRAHALRHEIKIKCFTFEGKIFIVRLK